jgi:hypothetical protein
MAGVVLTGDKEAPVKDWDRESLEMDEVRVEIGAAALCRSDMSLYYGDPLVGSKPAGAVVPGHEPAGTIVEVGEAVDHLSGFFELHRQVAIIVIDAQMLIQTGIPGPILAQCMEEIDGFPAGFQVTQRFGFQPEVKFLSCPFAELGDMLDRAPKVFAHDPDLLFGFDEIFIGSGDGADASFDSLREQLDKQIEQQVGVFDAVVAGPVREINLLFDPGAVEPAVRKSVDGKDITVMLIQPTLEPAQCGRVTEFLGRLVAQPEPDGVRLIGTNLFADCQGITLERIQGLLPGFSSVDIGAVGQVEAVLEFHRLQRGRGFNRIIIIVWPV